jgi:hypothetical protein
MGLVQTMEGVARGVEVLGIATLVLGLEFLRRTLS